MQLTLAAALKLKNKLVREMQQHQGKFVACNSYQLPLQPTWDAKAEYGARAATMNRLIAVKTAICIGNQAIAGDILRMGEIKNLITILRTLDTKQGKEEIESRWDNKPPKTVEFKAVYSEKDVDSMIKQFEIEIELYQERIDKHNHSTTITIPDMN